MSEDEEEGLVNGKYERVKEEVYSTKGRFNTPRWGVMGKKVRLVEDYKHINKSEKEHVGHVNMVLRLNEMNLKINLEKCFFFRKNKTIGTYGIREGS